jgi:hypothetical protein
VTLRAGCKAVGLCWAEEGHESKPPPIPSSFVLLFTDFRHWVSPSHRGRASSPGAPEGGRSGPDASSQGAPEVAGIPLDLVHVEQHRQQHLQQQLAPRVTVHQGPWYPASIVPAMCAAPPPGGSVVLRPLLDVEAREAAIYCHLLRLPAGAAPMAAFAAGAPVRSSIDAAVEGVLSGLQVRRLESSD